VDEEQRQVLDPTSMAQRRVEGLQRAWAEEMPTGEQGRQAHLARPGPNQKELQGLYTPSI